MALFSLLRSISFYFAIIDKPTTSAVRVYESSFPSLRREGVTLHNHERKNFEPSHVEISKKIEAILVEQCTSSTKGSENL